jgi:sterol desaturase/sphingolipid hydroxylase (fatty acid hydroxylase superfamily)
MLKTHMQEGKVATPLLQDAVHLDRGGTPLFRTLIFNLVITVLLIGSVLYADLYLVPAVSGKPPQYPPQWPGGLALSTALIPVAIFFLISAIERMVPPAGPRKSLKNWLLHVQMNAIFRVTSSFAGAFVAIEAASLEHHFGFKTGLIDLRFLEGKGLLPLLAAAYFFNIVCDFFFYWYHRALHAWPFLWEHHKLHHIDQELEAATGGRQNWIEPFLVAIFVSVPFVTLFKTDDIDPVQFGLTVGVGTQIFLTVIGLLVHANFRLHTGIASVLWCGPQVHRIHHSLLPQHIDKNFATWFPLWDVLFGTYYHPARDEFPPTGVKGEAEVKSLWESQAYTPRQWWKFLHAWRARQNHMHY